MLKILLMIMTLTFSLSKGVSFEYELAICAIFQNEDRFLDEWITYHADHGVDHFWLYNNNSTDNYEEVLSKYIESGLVELIDWPSIQEENDWMNFTFLVQVAAYNDCINHAKERTKWLAIIDTDEFILSLEGPISNMLNKYKNESAIALKWACFGTSGIDYCPSGEMLSTLQWRMPLDHPRNDWYKSIVKPECVQVCQNPHLCNLFSGTEKVLPRSEARLNHYWTRDETFLREVKIPRYEKWNTNKEKLISTAAQMNQEFDDDIMNQEFDKDI